MDSFLEQTARSIIGTMDWSRLSRTTLVLPSHRAGVVLKDALLRLQKESHAPVVWAPQVRTLTQLQDELSPLYAEDELFTIIRLYKHYRALMHEDEDIMPLDIFYNWGRQMLADFTNVDASMGASEVPNFFENTIAAHELERWKLDEEVEERLRALMGTRTETTQADSVRAQYERIWEQLYELYKALRSEMLAEQKGYAGLRQRAVIERWNEETIQTQIKDRTYVFVGFNYLLPVERELMTLLRDAGKAMFYWDYVPGFGTNKKAFSFAQKNSGILGSVLPPRAWTEAKEVTILSCVSREAQAQFVHRWLEENYTEKGQKAGVVICDETMLEPVIYALPAITLPGEKEPEPVNITKGFPLRNTAVYARALAWLNDETKGRADELAEPGTIDRLTEALFAATPLKEEPGDEQPLHWQELLALEADYQMRKILNQLRLLIAEGLAGVPFTMKLLRLLLRRMVEAVTMPFHGEPVTDIQIMGVLETRMLDFDKLLLLNVEEGVIPQKQTDISFIPFYLRKTYHMQTSDEKATIYAYNFFRLLSRAGHATLLYASADAVEGGKGMSRFIMQMIYSPEFQVTRGTIQEHAEIDAEGREITVAQRPVLSTLHPNSRGELCRENGKRYRLSPSALNTYISCPRSFYLQYIEGLRPKEEEDVLFEPATMGSFVHHAMEYIYTRFLGCDNNAPLTVTPEAIETVRADEAKLHEALMAAYEAMNRLYEEDNPGETNHYIPDHHIGENVIIEGYISNILTRDREDAKKGLQIYLLEQERMFTVSIEGVGEILTGGTIDRLDILGGPGNETLRVVDYKSGGYNDTTHAKKMSSSWEEIMADADKGYVRQTMIYSHAVMTHDRTGLPIEPNLFFCRRALTDIETTIDVEGETVRDYRTVRKPFYEALQTKIKEVITTTEFPQCEEGQCPAFCPFFTLCGRQPAEY